MNKGMKCFLEIIGVAIITGIIAMSSPLNPYLDLPLSDLEREILDIAHSVREGYLAYVELDGHYGPVLYEFFGLGYLLTDTHIIQFIMETVVIFIGVYFMYQTAKLYTVDILAMVTAGAISIFAWGEVTNAGAEELTFILLALTGYHFARQMKEGYLPHLTYRLAIDAGLIFFLQPGYIFIWIVLIVFLAIKFKLEGLSGKKYAGYYTGILEGLLTVGVPMGIYLFYFKNHQAFLSKVVLYNFNNMGSFADGLKATVGSPWAISVFVFLLVIIIKGLTGNNVTDLCLWLGFILVAWAVIALQGDNLYTYKVMAKALYVVPVASLLSFVGKPQKDTEIFAEAKE